MEMVKHMHCIRTIWTQINKEEAEKVMLDWIRQAQESKVQQLVKMAATQINKQVRMAIPVLKVAIGSSLGVINIAFTISR